MTTATQPFPSETPAEAGEVRAPAFPLATGYRLLCASKEYKLKRKCPYCDGALRMTINGCELDEATGWIATELDINCDTEPDIDGPEWEGWWADHSHDFCHAWHDLHEQLVACLKFTHRVSHDNVEIRHGYERDHSRPSPAGHA